MIPVGRIALAYHSGELDDDAAVALSHLPAELNYQPVSDPLVDVLATLGRLRRDNVVTAGEFAELERAPRSVLFSDRTVEEMLSRCNIAVWRKRKIAQHYHSRFVSQKRIDALELITLVHSLPDVLHADAPLWTLKTPREWTVLLDSKSSS